MDNRFKMVDHSNLMLVEIIYGNSQKYTQDDVLAAELELSGRALSDDELERLKNKVAYIGSINIGVSTPKGNAARPSGGPTLSESDDDDFYDELEGIDSILSKVLMVYIGFQILGQLGMLISGGLMVKLVALVSIGICAYGIYGILNRLGQPIILLIGFFAFGIGGSLRLLSYISSMGMSSVVIFLFQVGIGAGIIYFLTKSNMRSIYKLENDNIMKAVGIGFLLGVMLIFM